MKFLNNTRDILKAIKHSKPKAIFCPKCCSPNLKSDNGFAGIDMWLTPRKYVCEKCGYVGPIYMELEEEPAEDINCGKEKTGRKVTN